MSKTPLSTDHVRIFASQEAARSRPSARPGERHMTFAEVDQSFRAPVPDAAGLPLRRLSHWATRLLLRDWAHEAAPSSLGPEGSTFGAVRALSRALNELRTAGITAGHLTLFKNPSGPLAQLMAQLGRYEMALTEARLADTADIQRHAVLRAATAPWPALWATVTQVTVEPGVDVLGPRRDFLRALAARGIQVHVHVLYDVAAPHSTPWGEAMVHHLEALTEARLHVHFERPAARGALGDALARMAEPDLPPVFMPRVALHHVPAGEPLVHHVVHTLRSFCDAGARPEDIAVVLPAAGHRLTWFDFDRLAPRLAHALQAAGMAVALPVGPRLQATVEGQAVLNALRLAQQMEAPLAAGRHAPPPHLGSVVWSEHGIDVHLLASLLRFVGCDVPLEGGTLHGPHAQANLLGRVGTRRLGPLGLRRALRALRGVSQELATATAEAAQACVVRFIVPLCGGERPLAERVGTLSALLAQRAAAQGEVASAPSHPIAHVQRALRELYRPAQEAQAITSLRDAQSFVVGLLGEARMPPPPAPPHAITFVPISEIPGRSFAWMLALGLNAATPPSLHEGALSEAVRREINGALGPRLLQYGPVQGRAALPAKAQDQFFFTEMLRACTHTFAGVVLRTHDEAQSEPSAEAELLREAAGIALETPPAPTAVPVVAQPSAPMARRAWVAQGGWQAMAAPIAHNGPTAQVVRRLRADAERGGARHPALTGHTQLAWREHVLRHTHGTSTLDQLATCRYRYFAALALGLSQEPHPEHHMDRRRQGEAAHRALYRVYAALRQAGPLAHWRAQPQAAWQLAERAFALHERDIVPPGWLHRDLRAAALAQAWEAVAAQLRRDLAAQATEVVALEYRFGDPKQSEHAALTLVHPGDPAVRVQVRGSIDRVDHDGHNLTVVDYKSTLRPRPEGRHLQLALYQAVALRDFAGAAHKTQAVWQQLGEVHAGRDTLWPPELRGSPEEVLAHLHHTVWQRLDPILAGTIAPDPAPKESCSHCDFVALCGLPRERAAEGAPTEEEGADAEP